MKTTNLRVKFVRERAGLSQRGLSDRAGLATAHVGLIESGHVKTPDVKTITAIAKALQIEAAWLLFGSGPMIATRPELDPLFEGHVSAIESYLKLVVNPVSRAVSASDEERTGPVVVRDGFDQTASVGG